MHRWYPQGFASLYQFVSKRLSGKLFAGYCPECVKRTQRKPAHFLYTRGQGPSMAQLGMLRALRGEGTALVPRGQTTPCCCPTGHKMFGKGRAQMEECVLVNAFTMRFLRYVKFNCKD
ncbi:hypothetical protein EXN66_Car009350 [Channa argus]|uniref:Uncharacterized protein n=1 Tax=Channa argus TaxID=215402 RepID=A0A6G1PU55_CHAAH|nr:hypothetical protein EXN66_Car009350 [Channa argus]